MPVRWLGSPSPCATQHSFPTCLHCRHKLCTAGNASSHWQAAAASGGWIDLSSASNGCDGITAPEQTCLGLAALSRNDTEHCADVQAMVALLPGLLH